MRIAAGQARGATWDHERADARAADLERDRKVRDVVAQVARELSGGCCALHQHDGDSARVPARGRSEALVDHCDLGPRRDPGIGHVEALDPDGGQRRRVRSQHGLQRGQQLAGGFSRGARTVRDHVEGTRAESITK
jgi:hypothetical protein